MAEGAEADFVVRSQEQFRAMQERIVGVLSLLLMSVAAVARSGVGPRIRASAHSKSFWAASTTGENPNPPPLPSDTRGDYCVRDRLALVFQLGSLALTGWFLWGARMASHARGELDEARRHLKRARELAQVTGSARQRRRITDLARRIGNAA